jgi:PAS domain S-box-containing protein
VDPRRIAAPPLAPVDVDELRRALAEQRERAERKALELERLTEIGRRLATVLNPEELHQAIYEQMGLLTDTRNMFICLFDEARQRLYFPFYFEDGQRVPPKERPLSHGLTDHVIRTRQALLIARDYEGTTRALGIEPFGPGAKCWMGVPMLAEGRVLGVIAIWTRAAEGTYTEDLVHLVQTFANQAAIAVRNAQLYEALHEREETYRAVVETAARAGEGVAILRAQPSGKTRLAYVNDEFVRMSGYGRDELHRLFLEDLVPEEQLALFLGAEPRRAQADPRREAQLVAKGGQRVPVEVSAGQGSIEGELASVAFVRDITARKAQEREIAELRNFNQDLVETAPVGIAYLDAAGTVTYENPAMLRIMGVEGDLSPAMNMDLFLHPSVASQPELLAKLRALLNGDAFNELTVPFRALTGRELEITVSGVPIVRSGDVAGAVLLVRDVSAARRSERQLLELKNFNQEIVENAPIGIAYLDAEGRITYENPHLLRVMGHQAGELPRGWFEKVTELPNIKAKPELRERIGALIQRGEPFRDLTLPYTTLYGRELVVTASGVPLRDHDRVKGAVLLMEDVTAKASLEEQLRTYTERLEQMVQERTRALSETNRELQDAKASLETILASTADGIAALDPHGHLIFHNAKLAEMVGQADLQGAALPDVLRPGEPARARALHDAFGQLLAGQPVRALELDFRNARGEQLHVLLSAVPILHEGRVASVVATLTDISDRKALEDELRRYTQSLEQEVERRTARLIQSAKMAALGQLVAGVAHEMNNPLAYVKSNTENLLESLQELQRGPLAKVASDDKEQQMQGLAEAMASEELAFLLRDSEKLLENNLRGLERIAQIVLQLRNFASPQMGRMRLTDLNASLRDTVAIWLPQVRDRIGVHEEYGDIPQVRCDAGQLSQVVMNLIVNAGQAIPGKGNVWVRTRRQGPWVEVQVQDDGPGIPPDVLPKIWDPFFTTKEKGNTGLGLSISYNIVKEHGGEIAVDTAVGRGTTFTVRLPAGAEERAA